MNPERCEVHEGDCRDVLAAREPDSVDAIVTDPPYGLRFMGKEWDHGVPGVEFWQAALRVLKPGGHLLAFGGTRTHHRLACAIEDAGFEIRDCLMWLYGQGFPKSHDISKAIDKAAGAEREVVGKRNPSPERKTWSSRGSQAGYGGYAQEECVGGREVTAPATEAARKWDGWGTALKPAVEYIILARKPFKGTVADNVLKYGTGALNIDGCRIGTTKRVPGSERIESGSWFKKHGLGSGFGPRDQSQSGMNPHIFSATETIIGSMSYASTDGDRAIGLHGTATGSKQRCGRSVGKAKVCIRHRSQWRCSRGQCSSTCWLAR